MIRKAISFLIVVVLLVSSVGVTVFYYNSVLSDRDSKISSLQSQIAVLKTANLVTALGIVEVPPSPTPSFTGPITLVMCGLQAMFLTLEEAWQKMQDYKSLHLMRPILH